VVTQYHIEQYLLSESARQSAPPEPMIKAYTIAKKYEGRLNEWFVLYLADCFGFAWYRTTSVIFASGSPAANAQSIPGAMTRLFVHSPKKGEFNEWYAWIHAFLKIHPFQDGNGRIASILFNWGMNTMDNPIPLPYYEF